MTIKGLEDQLAKQITEADSAISMWEARCDDLNTQLDQYEEERKLYSEMCEEIDQLRVRNASLDSNLQSAQQTITTHQEVMERSRMDWAHELNATEIKLRQMTEEKDAVISQLNQDVADIQSKSEEAVMQWKGKCFV